MLMRKKAIFVVLLITVFIFSIVILLKQQEAIQMIMQSRGFVSSRLNRLTTMTHDGYYKQEENRAPNVPLEFLETHKNLKLNDTCAKIPEVAKLEFENVYWQTMHSSNGTWQIFGAYLDERNGRIVRMVAESDRVAPVASYCQLWFQDGVVIVPSTYEYAWIPEWGGNVDGNFQPYLISCSFTAEGIPQAVSLVENPCDSATNAIKIRGLERPKIKKDFAVCVKGMAFKEDSSPRLIEWIELLRILGADKIYFYLFSVHPNIYKMLKYYQDLGIVEVVPESMLGNNWFKYLQPTFHELVYGDMIAYNDCFYSHLHEFNYFVLIDTDEVIVPKTTSNWTELMKLIKNENRTSYVARNTYFFNDKPLNENVPSYMHMLSHLYRSQEYTKPGFYVKSIFKPENILVLHNHMPLKCIGACDNYQIETSVAQLQHYRTGCQGGVSKEECDKFENNVIKDETILKYKDELLQRVNFVLDKLGYFKL